MKRGLAGWIAAIALITTASTAFADDADISFGGSPRLLGGHKTISMQSEVVTVDVGTDTIHVDCRFVFKNDGPACSVRMGFPDNGRGGADPTERDPGSPLKPTFRSFTSYVDGNPVDTTLLQDADDHSDLWHVKNVSFAAGQTVQVRDVYVTEVGSCVDVTDGNQGSTGQAIYVLHTGSSWHGNIGRADVIVHMNRTGLGPQLKLTSLASIGDPDGYHVDWPKLPRGVVLYRGPSRPDISGSTIRFSRSDFKPQYGDDVLLYFKN